MQATLDVSKLHFVGAQAGVSSKSNWPLWLVDPTSVPLLHAADFWLGVCAFIVTLATFALGWRKLQKVETAALAAKIAVEEVKLRVSRYDAAVDASDALHWYREIARHLDVADWRAVISAMSSVRRSSIRMDRALVTLDQVAARDLRRAVKRLDKHISTIEEANSRSSEYPELHIIRASVRVGEDAFEKAKRVIEDSIS